MQKCCPNFPDFRQTGNYQTMLHENRHKAQSNDSGKVKIDALTSTVQHEKNILFKRLQLHQQTLGLLHRSM